MPMYSYRCDACQHADDEFQTMSEPHLTVCPKCQQSRYTRQVVQVSTDLREFHKPIEMYSVALNDDDEIKAFKRRCPDVDVATDPHDPMYGVPIARSRKQKLDALAAMDFQETN